MCKLGVESRGPIDVGARLLVGHSHLDFVDDGQIAKHVISLGYALNIGIRSRDNEVISNVKQKLIRVVLEGEQPIEDTVKLTKLLMFDVRIVGGVEGEPELETKRAGITQLQLREDGIGSRDSGCLSSKN